MPPDQIALAAVLFVTVGYAAVCAVMPFKRCRRCNGFGFTTTTDRKGRAKRGKRCRRCKGTGTRLRVGRRLWDWSSRPPRHGTR